jgi:steroid 5-alpha reductase family enzyme
MDFPASIGVAAAIALVYMTLLFGLALAVKDNSIADIGWGIGFILVAVGTLFLGGEYVARQILVTVLVLIWGLRLSTHIYVRHRGKGEDPRYKKWREEWGKHFVLRSYLQVFVLQGFFMLLISLPVIIVNTVENEALAWPDWMGLAVWAVGFTFEAMGDYQLSQFVNDPANRGRIIDVGLWRYTRHPNYFGEVTQWWGIFIIAARVPYGWIGLIGPLTITLLILKVSGIPMLEKRFEGNPEWEAYKRRTSVFLPWFPKRDAT